MRSYVPASASASNKIKHFAWLDRKKGALSSFIVQTIHDVLQDVERREASHAAAIERQQAESSVIERVWLSPRHCSRRLLHGCANRWYLAFLFKKSVANFQLKITRLR